MRNVSFNLRHENSLKKYERLKARKAKLPPNKCYMRVHIIHKNVPYNLGKKSTVLVLVILSMFTYRILEIKPPTHPG
jgi:hypothetical protein